MADKGAKGESEAAFAKRIDPKKEHLTPEQKQFIQRVEMEQWKKNMQKLRGRNILTGLAIGAMVIGIDSYTFYSVSQERIMDEIDKEASVAQMNREKTASN
uniref:Cytochrome c oxidase assembly factor 3 n=1 Tax=Paramormyrops kingsleyae TaxID=1676925 RepID=A0A3B3QT20_9TELE